MGADLVGEQAEAGDPEGVLLLEANRVPAGLADERLQLTWIGLPVEVGASDAERRSVVEQLPRDRGQLVLLGAQLQVHQALRGRPRIR